MLWTLRRSEIQYEARLLDRSAIILSHSHVLFRFIYWILFWVPRGKFATTIGPCLGFPEGWSAEQVRWVLPHEIGHIKQFRWCGFGIHPWLGLPLMAVLYVLLFFPVGLAWFRYRLELHAESFAWRVHLRQGTIDETKIAERARQFGDTVAGWTYLKPWPRSWVQRGFLRAASRIVQNHKQGRNW